MTQKKMHIHTFIRRKRKVELEDHRKKRNLKELEERQHRKKKEFGPMASYHMKSMEITVENIRLYSSKQ